REAGGEERPDRDSPAHESVDLRRPPHRRRLRRRDVPPGSEDLPRGPDAHVHGDGVIADEVARATELHQVLRPDGSVVDEKLVPPLDRERALRMYRGMLLIRIMDERLMNLQRQGRIGFYGEARGQEAAIGGSAGALGAGDASRPPPPP